MSKRIKPIWMPLYIEKFLADTTGLTLAQKGAYVMLLCAMWRSDDGVLPNDDRGLSRSAGTDRRNWLRIWHGIKHLFDVDGDLVTSAHLQSQLGKSNAIIVTRRAAGALGATVRALKNRHYVPTQHAPKPLKTNDGGSANAKPITITNIKEEEERSGPPRPETGGPSLEEGLQERASVFPLTKPTPPENPISDEERQVNLAKLHDLRRQLKGGAK
jgi:uncharacterized protein YdaU (DUF1376 family)